MTEIENVNSRLLTVENFNDIESVKSIRKVLWPRYSSNQICTMANIRGKLNTMPTGPNTAQK